MRELSPRFFHDLKDGMLTPILERIKKDNTLMLAIRDNYINVYYRGGSILKIEETPKAYSVLFNSSYDKTEDQSMINALSLPKTIDTRSVSESLVSLVPSLKEIMDFHFTAKSREEREYQQVVVRENNYSSISNETEYFIIDIEIASPEVGGRFDLAGINWDANKRQHISKCKPAFIEMKYGDSVLGGSSGMMKHLDDMESYISNKPIYTQNIKAMEAQFSQLDELGLFSFNHPSNVDLRLNPDDTPEFIFLLANHNPRASKLRSILTDKDFREKAKSSSFELLFSSTTYAGYSLHSRNMLTLDQFIDTLPPDGK